MNTDNISVSKFSEKDWPIQMLIALISFEQYTVSDKITENEKLKWESIDSENRISTLTSIIGLLSCEIDRIEHTTASSKSIDDIMIRIHGKEMVEKMKSDTPLIYNAMCSGMKSYASQKCTEQRRNVLNSLTATPFFIKHRAEFPRSLVLSAPEPKL